MAIFAVFYNMSLKWSREFNGEMQLFIGVFLFGVSFIGQKSAMNGGIQPITYNACRFIISTILLLSCRPWLQSQLNSEFHVDRDDVDGEGDIEIEDGRVDIDDSERLKVLWFWGTILGLCNFFGSVLQQISLVSISVATAGFISGMYVVVIPIVEWFIPGRSKHLTMKAWISALLSVVGLFFISGCANNIGSSELDSSCLSGAEGRGEILVFISMFCWVVSILCCDICSKKVDCISLTSIDFCICTVLSIALALILEPEEWVYPYTSISNNWKSIVFVGFIKASAYVLTMIGQIYTTATRAALLYSMEGVFTAGLGYLFLNETLTYTELIGCLIMLIATILSSINYTFSDEPNATTSEQTSLLSLGSSSSESHVQYKNPIELTIPFSSQSVVSYNSIQSANELK